jgi:hypothetical protein
VLHVGKQTFTLLAFSMQVFGSPVESPPEGPTPAQSADVLHVFVHQTLLHVRSDVQVLLLVVHGSPTPDCAQTGQL